MTDTAQKLLEGEGSGRIEYKRSALWPIEKDAVKAREVLMRLANANPELGGLIHLGREDDGKVVGLVDRSLAAVSETQLKASEQKLVQLAQRLDPPMQNRWFQLTVDRIDTIVVEVPGRARGSWYQDETGTTKTGTASHPVTARQALLQTWAREGFTAGGPLYELRVAPFTHGIVYPSNDGEYESVMVLTVNVSNAGNASSYVDSISFQFDLNGRSELVGVFNNPGDRLLNALNSKFNTELKPGRKQAFHYRLEGISASLKTYTASLLRLDNVNWNSVALTEVAVIDEIGNTYRGSLSDSSQKVMHKYLTAELSG